MTTKGDLFLTAVGIFSILIAVGVRRELTPNREEKSAISIVFRSVCRRSVKMITVYMSGRRDITTFSRREDKSLVYRRIC